MEIVMWIFTAIAIAGFFVNMGKSKWGYLIWFISNLGFLTYNIHIKSYAQAGLWLFYSFMCVYGFWKWHTEQYKGKTFVVFLRDIGDLVNKGDLGIIVSKGQLGYNVKLFDNKFKLPISQLELNKDIKLLSEVE